MILYYIIYSILYYTILYYTILYYTVTFEVGISDPEVAGGRPGTSASEPLGPCV